MTDALKKVNDTLKQLQEGKFTGSIFSVLHAAREELEKKQAIQNYSKLENTKQMFGAYRELHDKLQEISRAFVAARFPKSEVVYLRHWSIAGRNDDPDARIGLEMTYENRDGDDANIDDGRGWVSHNMHVYVEQHWLWTDDWKRPAEIAGVEAELELAQKRATDIEAAIPKRQKDVDDLGTRWQETIGYCHKLIEKLDELKKEAA
jgi:hypothetical protein